MDTVEHDGDPRLIETHILETALGKVGVRIVELGNAIFLCSEPRFNLSDLEDDQIAIFNRDTEAWLFTIGEKTLRTYGSKGPVYVVYKHRHCAWQIFFNDSGELGCREADLSIK